MKAYAKDRPSTAAASAAAEPRPISVSVDAAAGPRAVAIEQVYRDGALYRVEHAAVALGASHSSVPRPHLPALPPTSPRRSVRRSVLRLLAAGVQPEPADLSPAERPKIARKVIIRHISHPAAPAPLGLHTGQFDSKSQPTAEQANIVLPALELRPETLDEGLERPETPTPAPGAPAPAAAPQNVMWESRPAIDIHGPWLHEASIAPLVMVSDATAVRRHPAFGECLVQVDAVAAAQAEAAALSAKEAQVDAAAEIAKPAFTSKSLDLREAPQTKIYIHSAHPAGPPRAHARFRAEPGQDEAPAAREGEAPAEPPSTTLANTVAAAEAAVSAEEPLASDLIPPAPVELPTMPLPEGEPAPATATPERTAIPVWEVDRFQWPRTCEKLAADDAGYLASAGDKLLAAVQDGLKVLAITGTRRGEGRTTMALCLARVAAKAGVQVAIMDADFARPQIASKLGLETAHGWQDAALGRIPLSEAAVKSLADDITVLPLESSSVVRGLSLADPRVTATIRAVAATFELVILDLGPIQAGDQLAFPEGEQSPLDAAIVIRDVRFAGVVEGEAVGHMLQDLGVEAVGIAENFVIEDEIPATSV